LLATLSSIETRNMTANEQTEIRKVFENYNKKKPAAQKKNFDDLLKQIKEEIENINTHLLNFFSNFNESDTNEEKLQKLKTMVGITICLENNRARRCLTEIEDILTQPYTDAGLPVNVGKTLNSTFGKYIMFNYKRTGFTGDGRGIRYEYEITIDERISVKKKEYILVGFTSHSHMGSAGHYVFVKCNTDGKPVLYISDSTLYEYDESYNGMKWGIGVVSVIYKRVGEEKEPDPAPPPPAKTAPPPPPPPSAAAAATKPPPPPAAAAAAPPLPPAVSAAKPHPPPPPPPPPASAPADSPDSIKGYIQEAIGGSRDKTCTPENKAIQLSDPFHDKAKAIWECYHDGFFFPAWVCHKDYEQRIRGCFNSAKIYYDSSDDLKQVVTLATQREPANVTNNQFYYKDKLKCRFGYTDSPYSKSRFNIAIYTHTPAFNSNENDVFNASNQLTNNPSQFRISFDGPPSKHVNVSSMHIIHVYAPAFDIKSQADYMFYKKLPPGSDHMQAKQEYKKDLQKMFSKINKAYEDFKKNKASSSLSGHVRLILTGVGQGNFANECYNILGISSTSEMTQATGRESCNKIFKEVLEEFFIDDPNVFYSSYDPSDILKTKQRQIKINFSNFSIPLTDQNRTSIYTWENTWVETTLFVNAWDPLSMLGNGNYGDPSVDGWFGKKTAIAVIGWPVTNPDIKFEAVDYEAILKAKKITPTPPTASGGSPRRFSKNYEKAKHAATAIVSSNVASSSENDDEDRDSSGYGYIKKILLREKTYRNLNKITNKTSRKKTKLTEIFKPKISNNKTLRNK